MTRTMIDCTGPNAQAVYRKFPNAEMIAGYDTGTNEVVWSAAEIGLWPSSTIRVIIDQGYHSPAVTTAVVRDVESGAWTVPGAVARDTWSAAVDRPTIYCDQNTLPEVIASGWTGDLWIAIIGWQPGDPLPAHGECTVVAVQNQQGVDNLYDSSIVLDPYWPHKPPQQEEETMLNVQVDDQAYIPFAKGSFKTLTVYKDFNAVEVRVAVHSASKGYTVIPVKTASAQPATITFAEADVNAVSISGVKDGPVGVTLA